MAAPEYFLTNLGILAFLGTSKINYKVQGIQEQEQNISNGAQRKR